MPLLLAGLGVGALASQLGAVTVSSVPDELSGDVGGLQNTATNLGASLGTALAGSVLIAGLTASFLAGIENNPAVPPRSPPRPRRSWPAASRSSPTTTSSDALDEAGLPADQVDAIADENESARIDGLRLSLSVLALAAVIALFLTRLVPTEPVGGGRVEKSRAGPARRPRSRAAPGSPAAPPRRLRAGAPRRSPGACRAPPRPRSR